MKNMKILVLATFMLSCFIDSASNGADKNIYKGVGTEEAEISADASSMEGPGDEEFWCNKTNYGTYCGCVEETWKNGRLLYSEDFTPQEICKSCCSGYTRNGDGSVTNRFQKRYPHPDQL